MKINNFITEECKNNKYIYIYIKYIVYNICIYKLSQ